MAQRDPGEATQRIQRTSGLLQSQAKGTHRDSAVLKLLQVRANRRYVCMLTSSVAFVEREGVSDYEYSCVSIYMFRVHVYITIYITIYT